MLFFQEIHLNILVPNVMVIYLQFVQLQELVLQTFVLIMANAIQLYVNSKMHNVKPKDHFLLLTAVSS